MESKYNINIVTYLIGLRNRGFTDSEIAKIIEEPKEHVEFIFKLVNAFQYEKESNRDGIENP